jgi:short-subunit dehydrogenase
MKIVAANILVTGASSGIGAELACVLAERGATVGLVARRRDRLEQVLERCRVHAPRSRLWVADLADLALAERVALEADQVFGGLDALVANAGIPCRVPAPRLTADRVTHVMNVDFNAPMRMSLALLPRMLERGRGQLVLVSSLGGRLAIPNEAAYNAAKFALCGLAEGMFVDLAGTGVEVKLVLPGPIDTEIWDQPGNEAALFAIDKVSARDCAEGIAAAMEGDGFEYYVPAIYPGGVDARALAVTKTQDCDAYLRGMGEVARALRTG